MQDHSLCHNSWPGQTSRSTQASRGLPRLPRESYPGFLEENRGNSSGFLEENRGNSSGYPALGTPPATCPRDTSCYPARRVCAPLPDVYVHRCPCMCTAACTRSTLPCLCTLPTPGYPALPCPGWSPLYTVRACSLSAGGTSWAQRRSTAWAGLS